MAVRIIGTVGLLTRSPWNRSGFLRCCSVNYEKMYPERCVSPINIASRNFSLETLTYYSSEIFRKAAESDVTNYMQHAFTYFHDVTGLPWWCSIFLSGIAFKFCLIPFHVYKLVVIQRLININKSDLSKKVLATILEKQKANKWTPEKAKYEYRLQMLRERKRLMREFNCHPLRIALIAAHEIPVWFFTSITWRTMSYGFSDNITSSNILTAQMLSEGPFWCSNLTEPDPTLTLPVLLLISYLANTQLIVIQKDLAKEEKTMAFRIRINISRISGVVIAAFSSYLPAAVSVFWLSSSISTLIREFTFTSSKVRQVFKLPNTPFDQKDVIVAFKERFTNLIKSKGKVTSPKRS